MGSARLATKKSMDISSFLEDYMKAELHISGTDYFRISTHVRLGVKKGKYKLYLSPWSMRRNGRDIILDLLKRVRWHISWKSGRAIIFEARVSDQLASVIEMIYRMPRIRKKDAEKWKSMPVEALHDELLPLIVANNLKQH
jgi:hypothetical protein